MLSKEKKKWMLLISVLLLSFAVGIAQGEKEIAKVNDMPVVQQELDREMQRNRALVAATIVKEVGVKEMNGFWTKNYGGQTPLEALQKKALDELVIFKVQEQLLKERNLWPYDSYAQLIEDLERTNKEREKAKKEGKTIYGPVSYTEQSFFDYQFTNALIRLKEKLEEEKILGADEENLKEQFEKMKATVYLKDQKMEDHRRQIHAAYIEHAYKIYVDGLAKQAKVELIKK